MLREARALSLSTPVAVPRSQLGVARLAQVGLTSERMDVQSERSVLVELVSTRKPHRSVAWAASA